MGKRNIPFVSIIIANWNGRKLLKKCLASIKNHTDYPNFDVIVVDNGSTDNSAEFVRKNFPWVKLIKNKRNLGFAKANNRGIKHALKEGSDYIFLLNNDTRIIHNDWLTRMIEIAEANFDVGITGCKLIYPDGKIQHAGAIISVKGPRPITKACNKIRYVDYVTGAAFLIKREVINRIGLFDERFSPAYYEETDYCMRARKAGYRIMYNPRTTIIHYEGMTAKRYPTQMEFYKYKNRIRFNLLNFPLRWLLKRTIFEIETLITCIFEKKYESRKLSPLNVKLRNDWNLNLLILFEAYAENLKCLNGIVRKRITRTSKIWC